MRNLQERPTWWALTVRSSKEAVGLYLDPLLHLEEWVPPNLPGVILGIVLAAGMLAFDRREISSTGTEFTTLLGLISFLTAGVLARDAIKTRANAEKLKMLPESDRAKTLDSYVTRYGIKLPGIAPALPYNLARGQLNARWRKEILASCVSFCVSLCCLAVAFPAFHRLPTPLNRDADRLMIDYMLQVESLRGDFEGRNPGWSMHVRLEGLRLASLIGDVNSDALRPARKIIQHEYRGWALLIVARTFGAETEERDAMQYRVEYATQAIVEFDASLAMMRQIELRFREGWREVEELYEWMTGESADINRTHYLKAVALAVIARAGGRYSKADVQRELALISPTYLISYPPDNNPDLKWALSTR
jgi:hypothetical protein